MKFYFFAFFVVGPKRDLNNEPSWQSAPRIRIQRVESFRARPIWSQWCNVMMFLFHKIEKLKLRVDGGGVGL